MLDFEHMKYIFIFSGIVLFTLLSYLFIWTPLQTVEVNDALPQSVEESRDEETTATSTPATSMFVSEPVALIDTPFHPASGYARIVESDGNTFLRYEDLDTINGPDLFVYLATDDTANEFINLGKLRATKGNANYDIPLGTDLSIYSHALIWCRAFGVLFNSADLSTVLNEE